MLRPIDKEIPPELLSLTTAVSTLEVVIGDQLFQLAPMTYSDIESTKSVIAEIAELMGEKENRADVKSAIDAIQSAGLMSKILTTYCGLGQEHLEKITIPQTLDICGKWLDINFFVLPERSQDTLLRTLACFVNTIGSIFASGQEIPVDEILAALEKVEKTPTESNEKT